jgi:hypothetical protein
MFHRSDEDGGNRDSAPNLIFVQRDRRCSPPQSEIDRGTAAPRLGEPTKSPRGTAADALLRHICLSFYFVFHFIIIIYFLACAVSFVCGGVCDSVCGVCLRELLGQEENDT